MQEKVNNNSTEKKPKKGWIWVVVIILILALVAGGFWWQKDKKEEAQEQAREEAQKKQEAEDAQKAKDNQAQNQANQKNNSDNQDSDQHQGWETYQSENAKFSLQYPPTVKLVEEVNSSSDGELVMVVTENKIDSMDDQAPLGYGKETATKDQQELAQGKFGEEIDMPLEASKKVVKINDQINGKSFVVLGRFDVCSVTFEKQLIFYNNGYQIVVDLYGPIAKIETSMPKYFVVDQKQCGTEKMWDLKNTNVQDEFYQALIDKKGSGLAQSWFDTMDEIMGTVKVD